MMTSKPFLFISIIVFSLTASNIYAQYNESIRTGRPGQAIGPYTVGKGVFQLQSGVDFSVSARDNEDINTFVSDNVIRIGVTEHFEVSTLFDYQHDKYSAENRAESGISNWHIGFRYNIIDTQKGWLPTIGFQTRFKLPINNESYEIDHLVPTMLLVTGHSLGKGFGLTTNWGLTYNGITPDPVWKYVLNFSFPIHGDLSGFVENYGTRTSGDTNTYFDGGLALLINNNLQLDISGGAGKNEGVSDRFLSFGVSYRVK